MNILVYGAGVVGSFFAAQLHKGGHKVAILARGQRLSDIKQYGIVLEDALTGEQTTTPVRVVETVGPGDVYDFVLVAVRKNQVYTVLPVLAQNKTPRIVFMVNNAAGPHEYVEALGAERVFLSFSCTGGVRKGHVISCLLAEKYKIPLGCIDKMRTSPIIKAFNQAHIEVHLYNMDAWLKYHAALVSPLANAVLLTKGTYNLAKNKQMIQLFIRAAKEAFSALRILGYPVTPRYFLILTLLPDWILKILVKKVMNSKKAEIVIAGHALSAVDEMQHLSKEVKALIDTAGVDTPAFNELHQRAMNIG